MGSSSRRTSLRRLIFSQARQDSNLQPPVLEPAPSNAGIGAFVDFQRLSFGAATPALLDTAGVETNPDTDEGCPAHSAAGLEQQPLHSRRDPREKEEWKKGAKVAAPRGRLQVVREETMLSNQR